MSVTHETRDDMVRALLKPGSVIAEIGVFEGAFSKVLLQTRPRTLYLVDPFDGEVQSGNRDGNDVRHVFLPHVYDHLVRVFADCDPVILRRQTSASFFGAMPSASLDAVYLDGDHSYDGVRADLEAAARVVKPGGLVMGHDYEMNFDKARHNYNFGVKRAVDEFCAARGLSVCAKALDGCVSFAIRM